MPWISLERAGPPGPRGGEQQSAQRIRCDLCSWETEKAYWGPKNARAGAGVWWPKEEEGQSGARHLKASAWCGGGRGEGEPAWCPLCASRESEWARWSYHCTNLDIESVMSQYWRAPTGREWERGAVGPGNIGCVWEYGSTAIVGRVPPEAPPPGTSSQAQHPPEKRLAALEEEVAGLGLRVAELEGHSSGAATGWRLLF